MLCDDGSLLVDTDSQQDQVLLHPESMMRMLCLLCCIWKFTASEAFCVTCCSALDMRCLAPQTRIDSVDNVSYHLLHGMYVTAVIHATAKQKRFCFAVSQALDLRCLAIQTLHQR